MLDRFFEIKSNIELAPLTYELTLSGDAGIEKPGQFINIALSGFYLRRPLSVCDWTDDTVTVIYKVVGQGTKALAEMKAGEKLRVLTPLGNGYDIEKCAGHTVIIGGGAGVPPMYGLAKTLIAAGKETSAVLGWNTASEAFYVDKFKSLGIPVTVCTADGSLGVKGFVTDGLPESFDYFCTCGPEPMLKAVYRATDKSGQLSFEARMGCGFGACMGCSCETITGYKRICKDGPVLEKEEIKWQT